MKSSTKLIDIKEASTLLGVHPETLRRWDKGGVLKAVRQGPRGHRRYDKDAVLSLVNEQLQAVEALPKKKQMVPIHANLYEEVDTFPTENIPIGATYTFKSSIAREVRDYTHGLHIYPAKYIPQIPRWAFSFAKLKKGSVVLDPFVGCGTTLVEASTKGFNSYGIDINPVAQLLTKAKSQPLFSSNKADLERDLERVIQAARKKKIDLNNDIEKDLHSNWRFWFPEKTMHHLLAIHYAIIEHEPVRRVSKKQREDLKNFYLACLSSIIKKCSFFNEREIKVRKDKQKTTASIPDPFVVFRKTVLQQLPGFLEFAKASKARANLIGSSAQNIELEDESVDLIITSPPYINAIDYAMAHKYSLFLLKFVSPEKFKDHCREYIGVTERAVRSDDYRTVEPTQHAQIDSFIKKLHRTSNSVDKNRAFIVSQYFREMRNAFFEAHRVMKKNSYLIMVVGDNSIRGEYVPTSQYLQDIAVNDVGFELVTYFFHQLRNIRLKVNRNKTGGLIKKERVMILRKI